MDLIQVVRSEQGFTYERKKQLAHQVRKRGTSNLLRIICLCKLLHEETVIKQLSGWIM